MNKLNKSKIGDIVELTSFNGITSIWKCVNVCYQFKSWKCIVGRRSVNVIDLKNI